MILGKNLTTDNRLYLGLSLSYCGIYYTNCKHINKKINPIRSYYFLSEK